MREYLRGAAVWQIQVHQREIRRLHGNSLTVFPQGPHDVEVWPGSRQVEGAADGFHVGRFVFHN